MTIHQIKKTLSIIQSRNFVLSNIHSDKETDKYAPSHPQMKEIYRDLAYIAKCLSVIVKMMPQPGSEVELDS